MSPVVGGRAANAAEAAFTVALVDTLTEVPFCSGFFASPSVVVTAAHCVYDVAGVPRTVGSFTVAHGVLDANGTLPTQRVGVAFVVVDPRFETNPKGDEEATGLDPTAHDIAVVVLPDDVVGAPVARLADATEFTAAAASATPWTVAGFGVRDLGTFDAGILSLAEVRPERVLGNEFLAVPLPAAQGDACYGDSGGPLFLVLPDGPVALGVASRGRTDAVLACGEGGIWTRVDEHRRFILRASGDRRVAPDLVHGGCSVGASESEAPWILVLVALLTCRARPRPRGRS